MSFIPFLKKMTQLIRVGSFLEQMVAQPPPTQPALHTPEDNTSPHTFPTDPTAFVCFCKLYAFGLFPRNGVLYCPS